jgi:5-methylcytosine-specific restriction endonuclease McrA
LIQQNFTCPYTGDKLVLGVNASIDHIKPKKRFPELASDINNIEWVSFRVNYHKYDCTKEEFI